MVVWTGGTRGTQDAVANGDTRTLTIYHTHTRESATVTFRRDGRYDERALEQLNWLLRDWRRDEPTRMDPRLFDTLWEVYRETGSGEAVHVVSAYRSPATNAMLRRRSRAVAEHSQHMLGKAMDFYLPDVAVDRIRAIGMRLQNGGVGYYPTAGNPFIHLDVGSVRAWPRMTRDQLVRLFPDGRTVHVPADGRPLPGYEEARADVLARGGTVAGITTAVADAEVGSGRRRGFWATLFGIDEDEDAEEIRATRASAVASRARPVPMARPSAFGGDESPTAALMAYNDQQEAMRAARVAPARIAPAAPRPEVVIAAVPDPTPAPPVSRGEDIPAVAARGPVRSPRPEELLPAPTRVASLAAPDLAPVPGLAGQQGALGFGGGAAPAGLLPPLPPRRPEDITVTGTLVAPRNAIVATAPTPAPVALAISPPLPPARPMTRPVQVAAVGPIALPRAGEPTTSAPAIQAPARAPSAEDRATLRTLFSHATIEPPAPSRGPVTATTSKAQGSVPAGAPLAAAPTLRTSFSTAGSDGPPTGRFSGPAVKPLPVLR
jgi:uncharacterized protein YcbK (DUF882 family)